MSHMQTLVFLYFPCFLLTFAVNSPASEIHISTTVSWKTHIHKPNSSVTGLVQMGKGHAAPPSLEPSLFTGLVPLRWLPLQNHPHLLRIVPVGQLRDNHLHDYHLLAGHTVTYPRERNLDPIWPSLNSQPQNQGVKAMESFEATVVHTYMSVHNPPKYCSMSGSPNLIFKSNLTLITFIYTTYVF